MHRIKDMRVMDGKREWLIVWAGVVNEETGEPSGWEEYWEYSYPEDEKKAPALSLMEFAHKWKKQRMGDAEGSGAG